MPYVDHLHYTAAGAGQPVIFIHCPALSHAYWLPVMVRLQDRCRCIAFDLRGHGRSEWGDAPWTFKEAAADVGLLTHRLAGGQRPVLVGYSSGVGIALAALLASPGAYSGLVAVGGFSECSTLYLRARLGLGLLCAHLGLSPLVAAAIALNNAADPVHRRRLLADTRRLRPASLRSYLRESLRYNCTARLGEVQVPTLLVYGAQDTPMHPYGRMLKGGLPEARAVVVPGSDHRVPTRRPDLFAELLGRCIALRPAASG